MAERISALHGRFVRGRIGASSETAPDKTGLVLREVRGLALHQIAAWPDTLEQVAKTAARAAGVQSAPGPCAAEAAADSALLRIEPLKWWLLGGQVPEIAPEHGAILDLSHARTRLRIAGEQAPVLLNRHLALDLRRASFPPGAVASSTLHHVGVTLWHSAHGYELFIPRGFALAIWEVLLESAGQFGAEIV